MIELRKKDNEVDILVKYTKLVGGKPVVKIEGTADLSHHLVEGLFDILDRLAKMEDVSHRSKEWK